MKIKVVIEPIEKNQGDINLPFSYEYKGKKRMLLNDDSVVDIGLSTQKDSIPAERYYSLNKNNKQFVYEYESDPIKQTDKCKQIEEAIKTFWYKHPLVMINNKKGENTINPIFNLVNQTDKSIDEIKRWRNKLSVCNKLNEISYQNKVDISYYFGMNPLGITENELLLKLSNFENGVCLSEENIDVFTRIFIKGDYSDKEFVINARKALVHSIIEERVYEGKFSYYLGETFIGTSFTDIVAYFMREARIYDEYIVKQIESKENFESEIKESKRTDVNVNPDELESLKSKVKQLKDAKLIWSGFNQDKATIEDLKQKIKEGEAKKAIKEGKEVSA